jgi:hypothetical protein
VIVMLGLVACSGGGTPSVQQRCMTACARDNSLCSRTSDCAASCPSATINACASQVNAALDCTSAIPDSTYCANAGTTCGAQAAAAYSCLNPMDAGSNPDM